MGEQVRGDGQEAHHLAEGTRGPAERDWQHLDCHCLLGLDYKGRDAPQLKFASWSSGTRRRVDVYRERVNGGCLLQKANMHCIDLHRVVCRLFLGNC